MRPAKYQDSPMAKVFAILIGVPLLVLLSPLIVLMLLGSVVTAILVHVAAWSLWCSRGKYVLLVYSDSTIWKSYFESDLIPRIRDKTVTLNWSQRRRWRPSLATLAFRRYGGRTRFNPVAFVFRPYRPVKTIRYYSAFKEYKRGDTASVDKLTAELLCILESADARPAA